MYRNGHWDGLGAARVEAVDDVAGGLGAFVRARQRSRGPGPDGVTTFGICFKNYRITEQEAGYWNNFWSTGGLGYLVPSLFAKKAKI